MKKYFLMFIICVSSFMIYTNNVKADTCDNFYNANWNASVHSGNASVGFNEFTHNITNMGFNQNYDYIKLPIFVALTSSNTTSNINLSAMCSSSNLQFSDYTITYADGSTATINSNNLNTICTMVNYSGSNQYFYTPTIENVFIKLKYLDSNGQQSVYCNFENGVAVCPNPGANTQINGLIVQVGLNYNSSLINYGLVTGFVQWCHDDNQTIINKLNDINNKLTQQNTTAQQISNNTNEIKNDIKDSSIDNNNTTGTINNLSGQLATDNTITSLLLLPINFINVLIDGLSGECAPYSLGELWGTEIVLPCVNLYNTFGAVWYMVDTGLSALVIFKMSKYFIRLFNKLTNLKDGGLEEAYS